MEIVTTNNLNVFKNDKINGIYGDIFDLENFGIDVLGITYDDKWSVKRFLNFIKNKNRIKAIFKYLEIDESLLNLKINNLSHSEFKWILLSYMLIHNKSIFIFDYFDVGLTYKDKKRLINIIKNLKKDGKQIMVLSNDLIFMNKVVENFYVLKDGDIIYEGNIMDSLKKNLVDKPEIIDFINLVNKRDKSIELTLDNNELLKNIYRSVR